MTAEQRVKCAANPTGVCEWQRIDPDDGRPCWSLCALETVNRRRADD